MTIKKKQNTKGHVEFRQPPAKLVAERPEDEAIEEHLDETIMHDGYPSSCGIVTNKRNE